MKNKISKIILGLLILVLFLIGIVVFDNKADVGVQNPEPLHESPRQGVEMQVYFLDVGQGDATYIRTPSEQDILIDGGPDKSVLNELGRVMPFWDREIDVMILTHPHSDHVTGLVEVLRRYKVNQIYYTGVLHTAPDYLAWLDEIKKQNLDLKIVEQPFEIDFGNEIKLQFLYPQKSLLNQKMEELNNSSIVNRLVYRNISFLFTGDAEEEVEKDLLEARTARTVETRHGASLLFADADASLPLAPLQADVLKVGHHGSSSSSSEDFLKAVDPRLAIISCGQDNGFGHPHLKILKRFERQGVKVFRTDEQGAIMVSSDGNNIFY